MYNKKCTYLIFILIFLPTFLDGLQRKEDTEKLSNNLISDDIELPKEWKNQDWGKTERLLQQRKNTQFSRSLNQGKFVLLIFNVNQHVKVKLILYMH